MFWLSSAIIQTWKILKHNQCIMIILHENIYPEEHLVNIENMLLFVQEQWMADSYPRFTYSYQPAHIRAQIISQIISHLKETKWTANWHYFSKRAIHKRYISSTWIHLYVLPTTVRALVIRQMMFYCFIRRSTRHVNK